MTESKQSYCKESRVQFFWPTMYSFYFNHVGRYVNNWRVSRFSLIINKINAEYFR